MPVPLGQIQALVLLLGGVDEAARALDLDEEVLQAAFDDQLYKFDERTQNKIEAQIILGFEDYYNEHSEDEKTIREAGYLFGGLQLTNDQEEKVFDAVLNEGADFEEVTAGLEMVNALPLSFKQANAIFNGVFERNASFNEMLAALERDSFNLQHKDSAFWKWFEEHCIPS